MSLDYTFRPIQDWPRPLRTDDQRQSTPFRATYGDTLGILERELDSLDAGNVVLQVAVDESHLRLDGMLRADARPRHPGVILAFDSRHGPLRYFTDRFRGGRVWLNPKERTSPEQRYREMPGWQVNLRAIALGLEALRKVDRYGIADDGQQYRGYRELPAGTPMPATHMTTDEAWTFLARHGGPWSDDGPTDTMLADFVAGAKESGMSANLYRLAAKRLHPDAGGDPADFQLLQAAKALLERTPR